MAHRTHVIGKELSLEGIMDLNRWQRDTRVFCLFPMCHAAYLGELTNYIKILSDYIYSHILVFGNHIFGQLDGYLKNHMRAN